MSFVGDGLFLRDGLVFFTCVCACVCVCMCVCVRMCVCVCLGGGCNTLICAAEFSIWVRNNLTCTYFD